MPLPKINTPTYELELPSSGKKVKYRPFLVREEKILIMALESQDMKQITSAITNVLKDCIITRGVKIKELATFDIEYLFLNVRAKSVGETVEVNVTCPDDDETQVQMEIDIDAIQVQKDSDHTNFEFEGDDNNIDKSFDVITACIGQVYNEEESWSGSDCTKKELKDFVESMNSKQFKDVESFFTTMPKLSHTIKVKNPNTQVESEVVLEGLASFFS